MIHYLLNLFRQIQKKPHERYFEKEAEEQTALRAYTLKMLKENLETRDYICTLRENAFVEAFQFSQQAFEVEIRLPYFLHQEADIHIALEIILTWGVEKYSLSDRFSATAPSLTEAIEEILSRWFSTLFAFWELLNGGDLVPMSSQKWTHWEVWALPAQYDSSQNADGEKIAPKSTPLSDFAFFKVLLPTLERVLQQPQDPFHYLKVRLFYNQDQEAFLELSLDGFLFKEAQKNVSQSEWLPRLQGGAQVTQYFLLTPIGGTKPI
ncbi:DUF6348 family protein [Hugenholtzia roseola]|uniref:DUF6348 family protein n=1 Tax=Hugenholtzia roseola TaxID=1002 RepID=UPI00040BBEF6|nr:DUF6348 family protein [Hugenholtzia roseola]